MTPKETRIAFLNVWIASQRAEINALGSGFRSGADSCDEGLALASIREAEEELSMLDHLSDETAKVAVLRAATRDALKDLVADEVMRSRASGLIPRRTMAAGGSGDLCAVIQFEVVA